MDHFVNDLLREYFLPDKSTDPRDFIWDCDPIGDQPVDPKGFSGTVSDPMDDIRGRNGRVICSCVASYTR